MNEPAGVSLGDSFDQLERMALDQKGIRIVSG